MTHPINPKELAAVSALTAEKRLRHFLNKVADREQVWSVADERGWSLLADDFGAELVPVWPAEEFASACCVGEWSSRSPKPIPLADWMDKWLPGIQCDGRKVAVFPVANDKAMPMDAAELAHRLAEALEAYE